VVNSLSAFPQLRHLEITSCYMVQGADITPLRFSSALQTLDIRFTVSSPDITNLSPLTHCLALTELDISRTQITDLRLLPVCMRLRKLRVTGCRFDTNLEPLTACSKLQTIRIGGIGITDIEPLR
ncbi:hypothetical protein SARC_06736, partial [Sphaeroforma arctica JP610]